MWLMNLNNAESIISEHQPEPYILKLSTIKDEPRNMLVYIAAELQCRQLRVTANRIKIIDN